jgi:hypothetical protein
MASNAITTIAAQLILLAFIARIAQFDRAWTEMVTCSPSRPQMAFL